MSVPRVAPLKNFWTPSNEGAVTALKALAAEMRRKEHDGLKDIPVSPDLGAWIEELERIITELTDHR